MRIQTRLTFVLLILFIALLALCANGVFEAPAVCQTEQAAADEFMWYYLPHETDVQPEPMEKAPYIQKHRVIFVGSSEEKKIYLTFDDCPNNDNIPKIIETLKKHKATAAFFMTEAYIRRNPGIIRRIVEEGNLVCNHTAKHVAVTRLTFEEFKEQLSGVEDAYFDATGRNLPKYFRPPQGLFSERTLQYADELGYTTVFWSFRYEDWDVNNQPPPEAAYDLLMKETHPGEIALLHCQSATNVGVLDSVMTAWEEKGYSFGLISEIEIRQHSEDE